MNPYFSSTDLGLLYNVEIIGPVRSDPSWQTKAQQGFDSSNFQIDWHKEKVTCPQGHHSTKWLLGQDVNGKPIIRVRFNGVICRACPVRSSCTKSKTEPRELTFLPQVQHIALQTRRQTQQTPEWKATYNQRAGIESTHSQGIRRSALRQSRYIGLKKTHLMQVFIACALNLVRLDAWLNGIPFAQTRSSRFRKLHPQGA